MSETTPVPYIVHSQCLTNVLMALRMMHGLQWMIGNTAYEKTMPHSSSKFIQLAKHLHKPRRIQRSPVVQHLQGQSPQKA